jgi:hypothetical protein
MARKSKYNKMQSIEEIADIETPKDEQTVVAESTEEETVEETATQAPPLGELINEEPREVLTFDNISTYNDKFLRDKMIDLLDATNKVDFRINDNNIPNKYYITKGNARVCFFSKDIEVTSLSDTRKAILEALSKVGYDDKLLGITINTDLSYRYYDDESMKPTLSISRYISLVDTDNKFVTIVSQYVIEAERGVVDMLKALCRELSQRKLNGKVVSINYAKDIGLVVLHDKYIGIEEVINTLDDMYRG